MDHRAPGLSPPGIRVLRQLPHSATTTRRTATARSWFEDVRVPADHLLLGEGRGFEIARGRFGPGRVHHCMRMIGLAERALALMCRRAAARVGFGRPVAAHGVTRDRIAEARHATD